MKNLKAALAGLLAIFSLSAFATAAIDLGTPTSGSPYEAYMRPVKQVLGSLATHGTSLEHVRELMREGNSFRYSFTEPYVAALPDVTERTKCGDCKAKSLWIADRIGDRENIRFVIGKARSTSKISHAWIMWNDGSRWWILDCTNTSVPIAASSVSKNEYIPLYSYDSHRCYRHVGTQVFSANAASSSTQVAEQ